MNDQNFLTNMTRFMFRKIDAVTGIGLPNAVFHLNSCDCSDFMMTATSDAQGFVEFSPLCPGNYVLTELTPPVNYVPTQENFLICVDNCGRIFVNKKKVKNFKIKNNPLPIPTKDFYVDKMNPNGIALSGAVYQLLQNDFPIQEAITNENGLAHFCKIEPGEYTLIEIQAPLGYIRNTTVNKITVTSDTITINGTLTDILPVINYPILNANVITGNWTSYGNYVALVSNNEFSGYFNSPVVETGIQYAFNDPTFASSMISVSGYVTSPFNSWIQNLQNGNWYYRAYIKTDNGTYYYGDIKVANYP